MCEVIFMCFSCRKAGFREFLKKLKIALEFLNSPANFLKMILGYRIWLFGQQHRHLTKALGIGFLL